ncbi:MAG: hypothetical protein OXD50_04005 [Chloroflexi bacterium]|nr:hypothetical protein [Chloroflexota bacterium]
MVWVVGEFDVYDFAIGGPSAGRELAEEQAEFAVGCVEVLGKQCLEPEAVFDGPAEFVTWNGTVAEPADTAVESCDLLEQEVVVKRLGEVIPIGFERAEVGVDGGDGDFELVGDLLEGVSILAKLVFALHTSASPR